MVYIEYSPFGVVWPSLFGSVACFFFISFLYRRLMAARTGSQIGHPKLDRLAAQIKSGATAFLKEEYRVLGVFVAASAFLLFIVFASKQSAVIGFRVALCFLCGASLSALAGWCGMSVATDGNVRTTVACTEGTLNDGLVVAFTAGSIMGFAVVGLGLAGLSLVFLFVATGHEYLHTMQELAGFGFGASSIALFARVAGGIYTKAADVGADLVGKVEAGIDEDDPHNPAVIADNVGDNVGDVAGMGADLFESYVGSVIAAATLASLEMEDPMVNRKVALPFYLSGIGVAASIVGYFYVNTSEAGNGWNTNLGQLMWALEKGMFVAGGIFLAAALFLCLVMFGFKLGIQLWLCVGFGLGGGMLIGKFTEYFTSFDFGPVQSIKDRGVTGPATVIIQGIGVGMISCVPPVVTLVLLILLCSSLGGLYGVSISAVGMLSTLGITLATDAYGPVADNAGGLAEMDPSIPDEVRGKTDALDALGNTTAATGKGFAIASAVLTALSLLAAFEHEVDPTRAMDFRVGDPVILSGVIFGAMLPFLFAALTMISVGKAAAEIIQEVRRQFHGGVPGLYECIVKASNGEPIPEAEDVMPDSDTCVAISTRSSLREMLAPGAYAILAPLFVGLFVGPRCLMGVLAGAIASGCMMAIMMSNAGGAWDNGKKLCEKLQIKKTDQGKACVVGDTVGDPFKDTSGPALNILIKLMSMISLTIAPLIRGHGDFEEWYGGLVPLGLFVGITYYLVKSRILSWDDPLAATLASAVDAKGGNATGSPVTTAPGGVPMRPKNLRLEEGVPLNGHSPSSKPGNVPDTVIGHVVGAPGGTGVQSYEFQEMPAPQSVAIGRPHDGAADADQRMAIENQQAAIADRGTAPGGSSSTALANT
ncbi:unnamed protein product [Amoebophrya sp. A120]|nr:unnamed protein product [Amoebophrya sp. A120]|eukprot:GSA120T00005267001.1